MKHGQKQTSLQNSPSADERKMPEKCHGNFQAKLRCVKLILMHRILGHLEVKTDKIPVWNLDEF